jgi:hypothetical protein
MGWLFKADPNALLPVKMPVNFQNYTSFSIGCWIPGSKKLLAHLLCHPNSQRKNLSTSANTVTQSIAKTICTPFTATKTQGTRISTEWNGLYRFCRPSL